MVLSVQSYCLGISSGNRQTRHLLHAHKRNDNREPGMFCFNPMTVSLSLSHEYSCSSDMLSVS